MDNTFCTKTANHRNGEYHQITRAFTYIQVRAYDAALSYFEYQREHNADLGELALANLLRNLSRYGFRIRIDTFSNVRAKGQHKDLAQTCAYDFMKKGLLISILMLLMSIQRETVCSRKNQQNANFTISVLYFLLCYSSFVADVIEKLQSRRRIAVVDSKLSVIIRQRNTVRKRCSRKSWSHSSRGSQTLRTGEQDQVRLNCN